LIEIYDQKRSKEHNNKEIQAFTKPENLNVGNWQVL
jgi:hypothetical protein